MKIAYFSITKEQARFWLEKNIENRAINQPRIQSYVAQMNSGQWLEAADPIRFAGNFERLIDGQHRLTAFIQSNLKELPVLVVSELEEKAFTVIDTGKFRSAGDVLKTAGYESPTRTSAIARAVMSMKRNMAAFAMQGYVLTMSGKSAITNQSVLEFVQNFPDIHEVVKQSERWCAKFAALSATEYGAYYILFSEKNKETAFQFFEQLTMGANLNIGNPIYALRRRLEQDKMTGIKMTGKMRQHIIIYCWNAYRQGKEVKNIAVKYDNEIPKVI